MLKPDIEDPFYSFPGRRGPAPELSPQQTIYARRGDAAFADGGEAADISAVPRTFFCTGDGANVIVSAGAINNKPVTQTTITSPSDGTKIYIEATVDEEGETTTVTVESGATVPDNTETKGYKLLATVAVSGGSATPSPLGWNFTEMQKCGPTTYLWGGFGGG